MTERLTDDEIGMYRTLLDGGASLSREDFARLRAEVDALRADLDAALDTLARVRRQMRSGHDEIIALFRKHGRTP